jgi:PAS domain S-box-containing protein
MRRPGKSAVIESRAGLRDDAAQLRLIVDSVPAMSIAYDERLICTFANRRFAEFFGLTPETIVGRHLRQIIGEEPYREVKPYFDQVLAGQRTTYERTRTMEDGSRRYLEVELIPHVAEGGRVRGLFAVTRTSRSASARSACACSRSPCRRSSRRPIRAAPPSAR